MSKFFNMKNKVSNQELIDSLKKSIRANYDALDYILEKKRIVSDTYKYTEAEVDKQELDTLKYLEITLRFVGEQYQTNLKNLGVHSWQIIVVQMGVKIHLIYLVLDDISENFIKITQNILGQMVY